MHCVIEKVAFVSNPSLWMQTIQEITGKSHNNGLWKVRVYMENDFYDAWFMYLKEAIEYAMDLKGSLGLYH